MFDRPPELYSDALYVVGGLYGNVFALDRILEMAYSESERIHLIFNGDFNWFNVDRESFIKINESVLRHLAVRGNVETELTRDDDAAGCGCAYPEWVDDNVVAWSNQIMQRLRRTARGLVRLSGRLATLPMHLVAEVGGQRVAIVHGDAESLAGWSFAQEALSANANNDAELKKTFQAANVSLFASTHTCLPVVRTVETSEGRRAVVNNGAAGMPNLRGTAFGLLTRIATRPTPHEAVFGMQLDDLYIDLVRVDFDRSCWLECFRRNWPPGSPAFLSYHNRLVAGPDFSGPIMA